MHLLSIDFRQTLSTIIKQKHQNMIERWCEYFTNERDKEQEFRYYADFLSFFDECVSDGLDPQSETAKALISFLLNIKNIHGEELFFNFRESVYTCYLKFPLFEQIEAHDAFCFENIKPITAFFESLTSKIMIQYIAEKKERECYTQKELSEREAPISLIWNKTLMLSIVGTLDSQRVLTIIDKTLERIETGNIAFIIIDISAIYDVDTEVINQLIKLNQAVRFMGARAYLTGINKNIAKSLTHLDAKFDSIQTFSTVKDAMAIIIHECAETEKGK